MFARKRVEKRNLQATLLIGDNAERTAPHAAYSVPATAAIDAFEIRALTQLHADAFAAQTAFADGHRAYPAIENAIGAVTDRFAEALPEGEEFLEKLRAATRVADPDQGAVLAKAHFDIGYHYRGTGWAQGVTEDGWAQFHRHTELAHDAFLECGANADQSPLWHRMLFFMSIADGCSDEQRAGRFERALAFDPLEVNLYTTRAYQLLPRWHGSYEEFDAFARQSVARTRDDLGASLYARIYTDVLSAEHLPDMTAHWALMKSGFEDWLTLTDSDELANQYVMNHYASVAALYDDRKALDDILGNRLAIYFNDAWADAEQSAHVFRAYERGA